MKYEHVDFNSKWAASVPVEKFVEHEKHHGLTEDQLKEAHALCIEDQKPKAEKKKK